MGYKASVHSLPSTADVVIIGAGFAGMATAWTLARRGVTDVIVLEREPAIGRFASGRAAGLGRQLAEDDPTTALTVRGAALLRDLPGWLPTGGVLSFDDPQHAQEYVERAQRFGVPAELGGEPLVTAGWPSLQGLRVARALFVPSDGVIDVRTLLETFAHGARIAVDCPVQRLDGPTVITPHGAIAARVVVDAGGAWAGELVGEPLVSFKRHVFVLGAELGAQTPWLWHVGAGEFYVRRDPAGVLASPCDAAPCEPGHQDPDLVGEAHMRRLLEAVDSPLASVPITRRWACQRAFTEDRKMRLGRDATHPWLVWAAGLGGHGATASAAVGERVATAVIESL